VRYAWIKTQPEHRVRTLCGVLGVSTSGYYAWRRHAPSTRALDDARLLQQIERIHVENREAYGTVRVWRSLRREGERCGINRVRRLRQTHTIQTKRRRRYVRARSTYQRVPTAPNRLAWPFSSPAPNRIWVADITYVPTKQGWLYLATILDMHSRRIVGWAMGDRADQPLASAALDMALTSRTPQKGAIHHSDQGVQYTCKAYQQHLHAAGLMASMSRKGMPYDNAMMESFFASLKQELTHHERFVDRDEARCKMFDYIEVFYNRQRLHSGLNYQSPDQFEKMAAVA
jgi:putative transposase